MATSAATFAPTTESFTRTSTMDALSEFFDRVHLRGRLFYAGKVMGTLDLDKPEGTAFLHIVEKGGLDLVRPGYPNIPVREPSLLLCPSTCRYQLQSVSPEGTDIVCATFEFGASMGRSFPLGVTETMIFPFSSIDNITPLIKVLLAEYHADAAGRQKGLSVLFEYVLVLLIRCAIGRDMIAGGVLFAMLDTQLEKVLNAIHVEPEHEWTLVQMAETAGMSRSAFSAHFTKLVGVPPISYLTAWRMKLAQDMMRQGVKLKIVASSVGYSSQAAFSRAFVNEVGLPPAEWLKRA